MQSMVRDGTSEPELLSFLIADIRGWTSFTQSRGDEAAAALAGKFAGVAREGVEAYGGRLLELRGDEFMAVFTSARASFRAAVALQEVFVDETRLDPGLPLTVGMGLDAGEVVPVEGGYRGNALNRAARLCSLAKGGEALASDGVRHLAGLVDGIEVADWGTAEVKGMAEPVRAHLLSASDHAGPIPDSVGLSVVPAGLDSVVPMVGRDEELRRLSWAWRRARRGEGGLAVVRGPSGIGKTRLLSAVAEVAVSAGGEARLFGLALAEPDWDGLRKVLLDGDRPTLLAVDDAEANVGGLIDVLAEAGSLSGHPVLVVVAVDEEHAGEEEARQVRRWDAEPDLRLVPLDVESMRRLAGLYLSDADETLPAGLLESTGGVPRRLHQTVASWAEDRATRRLGLLASQAAGSRVETVSVESQLAGSVAELQLVRERTRMFGLGPGRHGPAPELAPYKGLDSFATADAESFFGRERLVADLIARAASGGLLAVLGPSGSGKSSLVRAGLVPALASGVLPGSEDWLVVVTRPGEHPVRALDVAVLPELPAETRTALTGDTPLLAELATSSDLPQVLVVIDQAEELFTVCTDEAERSLFLEGLTAVGARTDNGVGVVVTIRADYYGRFAADQLLASALSANQVLVAPMTPEEYRRAIARPAQQHGVTVEPDLVDALVDDVSGQPGALPLLSTALLELWEARADRTMSLASYVATGGLQAAVARLADSVHDALPAEQQLLARRIFLRLTGPGVGDTVVRRRVRLTDIAGDDASSALVDLLARRRLVTVSDGWVEVAHEALLREWPRFRTWLDEDREGIRLRAQLADAAASWETGGRDEGELYRGARLSATLEWTTAHVQELTPVEEEFVTASTSSSQAAVARQRRVNRRLRGLLAGVAAMLVLALVAGVVALVQSHQARKSAVAAADAETAAVARGAGATAQVTDDIPSALLRAVAAARLAPSGATVGQLEQVIGRNPELTHTGYMPGGHIGWMATNPDGKEVAAQNSLGQVALFDAVTLERLAVTQVGKRSAMEGGAILAFSPDGAVLAAAARPSSREPLVLLDAKTLHQVDEQLGGWPSRPARVDGVDFSADGRRIAVSLDWPSSRFDSGTQGTVLVWDLDRPTTPLVTVRMDGNQGVQLSPDGETFYVANPFTAFDASSGRKLLENVHLRSFVWFDLNPQGTRVVMLPYGDNDDSHALNLVSTRTGDVVSTAPGLGGDEFFQMVTWSANGRRTAAATSQGRLLEWYRGIDLERTMTNGDTSTLGLVMSPDGRTLYSGGASGEVQSWDLEGYDSFIRRLRSRGPQVNEWSARISPDGSTVAFESNGLDGNYDHVRVVFLDLDEKKYETPIELPPEGNAGVAGWSPDSRRFVTGNHKGTVQLIDVGKNALVETKRFPYGLVTDAKFTADGSEIAVSFRGGTFLVLDARTLEPVVPPTRLGQQVLDVNTNPQGHTAFVLLGGGRAWFAQFGAHDWALIDTDTGEVVRTGHAGLGVAQYSDFSPDGVHVVVVGNPSQFIVIDTRDGSTTLGPTPPSRGSALTVAYDHDGSRFFVGTTDNSVRVYDAREGTQVGELPALGIFGGFAPEGSIVVVDNNGDTYRWDPSAEAALDFACQQAGRNMTRAEWQAAFGDREFVDPCPQYGTSGPQT